MKKIVSQIMKKRPVCISKEASLKEITDIITSEGYSHVPVLDQNKLIGVVSKTDLVSRFMVMLQETSGKNYTKMLMDHVEVESIMHQDPITLNETDDIEYAAELLLQGKFHGITVTDDKRQVVGVVTAYDILKAKSGTD